MPVLQWAPALVETIGGRTEVWRSGCLPPLPELMVLGELAQAVADSQSDIGLDRIGLLLAERFVRTVCGRTRSPAATPARDCRRAVDAALWIDAQPHEPIDLETAANEVRTKLERSPNPTSKAIPVIERVSSTSSRAAVASGAGVGPPGEAAP
jgi:hypothetical protein